MRIGIIGLGIMGGAMARNLLGDGVEVVGFDVSQEATSRFVGAGGIAAESIPALVAEVPTIITSVATAEAFRDVTEAVASSPGARGAVVLDASTMPLEMKQWAHDLLATSGVTLLDCPISGTGAQAETRDLVFLASGDTDAIDAVRPYLDKLGRVTYDLGSFGSGSKMKYVANLLVGIHNAAAAEAMVLAQQAGIDPRLVFEVLYESAATSRMFQLRFPLMIENDYTPPTAKISMFVKDLDIIGGYASVVASPTPLLDVVAGLYDEAKEAGFQDLDAAAICKVLEKRAGIAR